MVVVGWGGGGGGGGGGEGDGRGTCSDKTQKYQNSCHVFEMYSTIFFLAKITITELTFGNAALLTCESFRRLLRSCWKAMSSIWVAGLSPLSPGWDISHNSVRVASNQSHSNSWTACNTAKKRIASCVRWNHTHTHIVRKDLKVNGIFSKMHLAFLQIQQLCRHHGAAKFADLLLLVVVLFCASVIKLLPCNIANLQLNHL